ncbi:hypothetical protein D3C73_683130 [compost metagenome]
MIGQNFGREGIGPDRHISGSEGKGDVADKRSPLGNPIDRWACCAAVHAVPLQIAAFHFVKLFERVTRIHQLCVWRQDGIWVWTKAGRYYIKRRIKPPARFFYSIIEQFLLRCCRREIDGQRCFNLLVIRNELRIADWPDVVHRCREGPWRLSPVMLRRSADTGQLPDVPLLA